MKRRATSPSRRGAGVGFPGDRETYDRNIQVLLEAVRKARIGRTEKADALRRLARIAPPGRGGQSAAPR